jgi:hypothetical protein
LYCLYCNLLSFFLSFICFIFELVFEKKVNAMISDTHSRERAAITKEQNNKHIKNNKVTTVESMKQNSCLTDHFHIIKSLFLQNILHYFQEGIRRSNRIWWSRYKMFTDLTGLHSQWGTQASRRCGLESWRSVSEKVYYW